MNEKFRTWGQCLTYDLQRNAAHQPDRGGFDGANRHLKRFTEDHGRSQPINRVDQDLIDLWQTWLSSKYGISNGTINRHTASVHSVLQFCHKRRKLATHPDSFEKLKQPKGRLLWFKKEQVDQIDEYCKLVGKPELGIISRAAANSGCRGSELFNLTVQDVDLVTNEFTVGGRDGFGTKNDDWRIVPITPELRRIFEERCRGANRRAHVFADDWPSYQAMSKQFRRVLDTLDYPKEYCFHTFRHTFGTWHILAGNSRDMIQTLLGHKSEKSTEIYTKYPAEALHSAMGRFALA